MIGSLLTVAQSRDWVAVLFDGRTTGPVALYIQVGVE